MWTLAVSSHQKEELIDITSDIQSLLKTSGIQEGLCLIYVPHTTAGITINENADPSVQLDILKAFHHLVPGHLSFSHLEGNSPAHIKATIVGSSVSLLIERGQLQLGTWQGIYFCEFDGPRQRKLWINAWSLTKASSE
jgi:secondary thiamine-phosphate synthase enzyme